MTTVLHKATIFLFFLIDLVLRRDVSYPVLVILLLMAAVTILQERFFHERFLPSVCLVFGMLGLTLCGMGIDPAFALFLAAAAYDFVCLRFYAGLLPVAGGLVLTWGSPAGGPAFGAVLLATGLSVLLADVTRRGREKERRLQRILDEERRLRYELEQVKRKLLHASREAAEIAEMRERNRIAREIHDRVGHKIAGILFQLQAANKLSQRDHARDHARDHEKAAAMVDGSVAALSEALELLRETVHNLKPRQPLGVAYIQRIIDQYTFCPVRFSFRGDFNQVPPHHMEVLATTIQEALTNAAKHSQATEVDIRIEIRDAFTRLAIRDNGVGAEKIREGLGLSGMRERIRNMGGTVSISGKDGFLIVCLIPREEGRSLFESLEDADRG